MNNDTQNQILNAIAPFVPGIITSYLVLVDYVGNDGSRGLYSATMEGQTAVTTLGLAAYVDTIERRRIADSFFDQEDDGDD